MVAYLTAPLKDRRHILRERDLRLGRLPARGNCREQRYKCLFTGLIDIRQRGLRRIDAAKSLLDVAVQR